jgi:2-polyprenyl-3-methyl-5-hydroxy-6-metoxy-1,4-benzoquinol methylase
MNPKLAVLETNLKNGRYFGTRIECFQSLSLEFTSDVKYDVVITEACIPGQDEPLRVLEKISEFVAPDGFLIITNTSKSSLL